MSCIGRPIDFGDYTEVEDTAWSFNKYDSEEEDLHVHWKKDLINIQDGTILTRIIRCQNSVTIPAKSGICIPSNIIILSLAPNYEKALWSHTESDLVRLQVRVRNLTRHWLSHQAIGSIWCKEGGVSLKFSSRLKVWVFNRTDKNLTLSSRTAIAELQTSQFEYE